MVEPKFTKGPWVLWVGDSGAFEIREKPSDTTIPEGVVICGRNQHANPQEGVANAHLIAAAQALYESLEAAKKTMRNCQGAIESNQVIDKDVHGNLKRGQQRIEAALKRARGEA